VYYEPGFRYLFVDENRNPRPEYPAIIASGSVFGMGWTDAQMATGSVRLAEQVPFGKYNLSPTSPPWPGSGVTVYAASYLGAPDGFFTLVPAKDLMKWANQPGLWILRFPGNLPFTKASWDKLLGRSAQQKCPPGTVKVGNDCMGTGVEVCPPGTVDVGGGQCKPLGTPGKGGGTDHAIPQPQPPVPPAPSGGLEAWIRGLSNDERDLLGGALIGVAVASGAAVLYWLSTQRKKTRYVDGSYESPRRLRGAAQTVYPEVGSRGLLGPSRTKYVDGVYEDAPRGLRGGAETVYPESQPRGLLGQPRALLANSSKRPKLVPVYVRSSRAWRKHEKVHKALQKMGGKLNLDGMRKEGHVMVYLFPPSKVRAAIATAKRIGGRRTVAKADKRIKVLGDDLVKFPKGFKRNPASIPMFWVGSGKKRERKWTAV
jgi:hypothetical protein